ncbi:MAG: peptide-methionine (R)-S-oxide reductase MsrB [Caulobacteraceae bacterium]
MDLMRRGALSGALLVTMLGSASAQTLDFSSAPERRLSEQEWRRRLTSSAYNILRRHHTELPFSSPLNGERRAGVYACGGCALPLFQSHWKYNSGTGWPSFFQVIDGHVGTRVDRGFAMVRTEYHCARCLGHQGHLFDDGPRPSRLRYCNNGAALSFTPNSAD